MIGVEYVVELRGRARGRGDSRGRFWQRRRTVGSMPHRGKGQTQSPCAGWKPLQGSAATMSQAGLQARAGSPDPLRGTRQVSVEFVHRRAPPRAVPEIRLNLTGTFCQYNLLPTTPPLPRTPFLKTPRPTTIDNTHTILSAAQGVAITNVTPSPLPPLPPGQL